MAITASEARRNLFPLIEQVNVDRLPIEITSKRGDAVLMRRASPLELVFLRCPGAGLPRVGGLPVLAVHR